MEGVADRLVVGEEHGVEPVEGAADHPTPLLLNGRCDCAGEFPGHPMAGVPQAVHIAWFDTNGRCLDHVTMIHLDPWHYQPPGAYRWAVEMAADLAEGWDWLDDSRLTVKMTTVQ